MTVTLPEGRRYVVTLALENELNLREGDEVQITTADGRLSMATALCAPLDISAACSGTPTGVAQVGDTKVVTYGDWPGGAT